MTRFGAFRGVSRFTPVFLLVVLLIPAYATAHTAIPYDLPPPGKSVAQGEYIVSVWKDHGWVEAGRLPFDPWYRTRELDLAAFSPLGTPAQIRIEQRGGGAAHVDAIILGGVAPSKVTGSNEPLALRKLSRQDFDVADAFGKTLEVSFPAGKSRRLSITARIVGTEVSKTPFQFPLKNMYKPMTADSAFYPYRLKPTGPGRLAAGRALLRRVPFFKEFCRSGSGHPSGYAYGWVENDRDDLYVRIDFSGDNTRDGDADYTKVYVKTGSGVREFKQSEGSTRWGVPSFTYTDKVPYQHKVYDFTIPLKEIGLATAEGPGSTLLLAFAAYGTLAPGLGVVSTTPDNNAVGVPVDNAITVVFDRAIDNTTVDNSTFIVQTGGTGVPGTFSFPAANSVAFTPSSPLADGTAYTVTLPGITGIQADPGLGGGGLAADYVFSFTTAGSSVHLFFFKEAGGCAVAGSGGTLGDGIGTVAALLVPGIGLAVRRRFRRRAKGAEKRRDDRKTSRTHSILFILFLAVPLLAAGSRIAQAGPFEAPAPAVKAGGFSLGVGYFHDETKWKPDTGSATTGTGVNVIWATGKVKQDSLFLKAAYGVAGKWEVDVRAGAANRRAPEDFKDRYNFFGGVAVRGLLYDTPSLGIGPVFQANYYTKSTDSVRFVDAGTTWSGTVTIENQWDASLGVAAQTTLGKFLLYAGPSLTISRADVKHNLSGGGQSIDVSNKYKEKSEFGGFAGLRVPLVDRLSLEVEGQFRDEFSAGGSLSYAF